jgi:hypothetical protein
MLTEDEVEALDPLIQEAIIGGPSHIAPYRTKEELTEFQYCAFWGEAAYHKYTYGHIYFLIYIRELRNKNKGKGDGGQDIEGRNIDVKTSAMRSKKNKGILKGYRLLVRKHDLRKTWTYIAGFVGLKYLLFKKGLVRYPVTVDLVGWATHPSDILKENTKEHPDGEDWFEDAYLTLNEKLNPLPPIGVLDFNRLHKMYLSYERISKNWDLNYHKQKPIYIPSEEEIMVANAPVNVAAKGVDLIDGSFSDYKII